MFHWLTSHNDSFHILFNLSQWEFYLQFRRSSVKKDQRGTEHMHMHFNVRVSQSSQLLEKLTVCRWKDHSAKVSSACIWLSAKPIPNLPINILRWMWRVSREYILRMLIQSQAVRQRTRQSYLESLGDRVSQWNTLGQSSVCKRRDVVGLSMGWRNKCVDGTIPWEVLKHHCRTVEFIARCRR